jgi:UDP-3-O-[3-hydroxymyristoyl] glucosamine N-acyltransferase
LAGAVVGDGAVLGADCLLHPRAMLLDRCEAGDRVILQAGAIVGSDGFGNVFIDGAFRTIPQVGNVVLGDDVEIGANTCIDRAQTGTTAIGTGTKIDNLVQIGHNCKIGNHTVIAGMVGLAGSTTIGDYCRIGGQSAFKGHITVGSRVTVAGNTMVWGDLPDDAFVSGQPAQAHRAEVRQQVYLRKLPKLFSRVDALEGRTERRAGDA